MNDAVEDSPPRNSEEGQCSLEESDDLLVSQEVGDVRSNRSDCAGSVAAGTNESCSQHAMSADLQREGARKWAKRKRRRKGTRTDRRTEKRGKVTEAKPQSKRIRNKEKLSVLHA